VRGRVRLENESVWHLQTGILGVDRPSSPRGTGPFLFYVFDFVGEGRIGKKIKDGVLHAQPTLFY